jgi:hypothetical protein
MKKYFETVQRTRLFDSILQGYNDDTDSEGMEYSQA